MSERLARLAWLSAAAVSGWFVFVRIQGNSEVVATSDSLLRVSVSGDTIHGEVTLANHGRQTATVRKVEACLVEGARGHVSVVRQGSRPHEAGWWVSNVLHPGESCVAELEIHPDGPVVGPITVEMDVQEIGRDLLVHRRPRLRVLVPAPATDT